MKLLVFGEIGQLGQELIRRAGEIELEVRGLDEADFTDLMAQIDAMEEGRRVYVPRRQR